MHSAVLMVTGLAVLASSQTQFWAISWEQAALFCFAAVVLLRYPYRVPLAIGVPCAVGSLGLLQLGARTTVYRAGTWLATLNWLSYAALFLIVSRPRHLPNLRARVLRYAPAFAGGISVLAIATSYTSLYHVLWVFPAKYERTYGPYVYRNHLACFLELLLPYVLYRAVIHSKQRVWCGLTVVVMIAALVTSGSRTGCILCAVEMAAVIALAAQRGLIERKVLARGVLLVLASAAGAVAMVGFDEIGARFREPHPYAVRREILASTADMILQHPIAGAGLGTWRAVYPGFAHFDPRVLVNEAHNDWAQITADGGIAGFALFALLAALCVRTGIRSIFGLGTVAVMVHAWVDYPFESYSVSLVFMLTLALAAGMGTD